MRAAYKALWFAERHLTTDLTLERIAKAAGVSRFHLTRAFGAATGRSLMQYVRERRLSEAAKTLVTRRDSVLTVAITAGYDSHEAFTRAFRNTFGLTPQELRQIGTVDCVGLVDAIGLDESQFVQLAEPRILSRGPFRVVGLAREFTCESSVAIQAQWERFLGELGAWKPNTRDPAYGVRIGVGERFSYISGIETDGLCRAPYGWSRISVPGQTYAVFEHDDHVSSIRNVWSTIWNVWLAESSLVPADGPEFEMYGPNFNPADGTGGFEIWIPIER